MMDEERTNEEQTNEENIYRETEAPRDDLQQDPVPEAPAEETPAEGAYRYNAENPASGMERITPLQYSGDNADGQAQATSQSAPQSGYQAAYQQSYQPNYQQTYQQAYQPAAQTPKKKEKKKVSHVWIPILIVAAILLGIGGGVAGYAVATNRNNAAVVSEETGKKETLDDSKTDASEPSVSDRVKSNEESSTTQTPAQIYSDYVNAVVGIASESTARNVWGQTVTQASSGSGFIITEDGYVVTNYHVVEGASNVTVQMYDGTEYPATIVGYESTTCDVALLKIDAENLPTVSIGNSDNIQVGEQVCAIGNPLGELTFTLTVGYISALDREINTDGTPINMFQTDAAINSGNSGGPLFDMDGNVIGITTAKYSGSTTSGTTVEGLGFAIPINDVMKIIDDLTAYGYVTGKPYLGVSVADSSYYGDNLPAGAYIAEVVNGYCAQQAGLQTGDVIVGVGDSVVGSTSDLQTALANYSAGDTVSVTVYRAGQYLTASVTLSERPADTDTQTETEATEDDYGYGDFGGYGGDSGNNGGYGNYGGDSGNGSSGDNSGSGFGWPFG